MNNHKYIIYYVVRFNILVISKIKKLSVNYMFTVPFPLQLEQSKQLVYLSLISKNCFSINKHEKYLKIDEKG